mgnify:FL=1
MSLGKKFYRQDAVTVAEELVGKLLIRKINGQEIKCRIVETEAYMGAEDKASHAYQNKRTPRTEVMFKSGGYVYVYLIYGMYYCFNVVTGVEDKPGAVLIRAVEPLSGIDIIKKNRKIKSDKKQDLTNGPGKLCQALQINENFDGYNLIKADDLYIEENTEKKEKDNVEIGTGKRVNIDYAEEYQDKLWRFYIKGNTFVSGN